MSHEYAILVCLRSLQKKNPWSLSDYVEEMNQLVRGVGVKSVGQYNFQLRTINSQILIGKGHAAQIKKLIREKRANLVILNHDLTGAQQRNLEAFLDCKTIDRTQLILDLFARRARSGEGQLQVELAQLTYLLPRLAGQGIYLSRLGGGIGTRGPGEQKLEMHRRRIRDRIALLKRNIRELSKRRSRYRQRRAEQNFPSVCLVGYTNAGKSTLFNVLSNSNILAKDQMFSTLDPTSRICYLSDGMHVMLVDTVGFLHELPHHLIEAFKATLEEVLEADLLLHVIDASHPRKELMKASVYDVIQSIGASKKRIIQVWNKIDKVDSRVIPKLEATTHDKSSTFISAQTGKGIVYLKKCMKKLFSHLYHTSIYSIPMDRMDLISKIYDAGTVLDRSDSNQKIRIKASLPNALATQIQAELTRIQ